MNCYPIRSFFWEQTEKGVVLDIGGSNNKMREPFVAGILSFLIPGVGQIYNGRIIIGIIWLILTGVSWIGSAGTLGWVVHIISAWCAYSYAKDNPART